METKICNKCGVEKDIDQFGRCRGKPTYRCLECQREHNRQYKRNKEKSRQSQRRYYQKKKNEPSFIAKQRRNDKAAKRRLRLQVLVEYGGNPPTCSCCGELNVEFLTIDHLNGGGNEHRRKIGGSARFYTWLRKNGFPSGYRVLCCNCNHSLGAYGYCPHGEDHANK